MSKENKGVNQNKKLEARGSQLVAKNHEQEII
jgi:hypothetical protein